MKRWIIVIGRGGTVLITIGLALLLVSLIPPASSGFSFAYRGSLSPKQVYPSHELVLTPKQGLQVTVTANGTLTVYIVEVSIQTLEGWIREHFPTLPGSYFYNVTRLEAFLEANPNSIGWQKEIREGKIEYVPTKVMNATLIFSNPSSDVVKVEYEGSITSLVAPRPKVRNLAQWIIPLGFVLALPWFAQLWKKKTTHKSVGPPRAT